MNATAMSIYSFITALVLFSSSQMGLLSAGDAKTAHPTKEETIEVLKGNEVKKQTEVTSTVKEQSAAGVNLITNGGFEEIVNDVDVASTYRQIRPNVLEAIAIDWPVSWQTSMPGTDFWKVQKTGGHNGSACMKGTFTEINNPVLFQEINLRAGMRYCIGLWLKVQKGHAWVHLRSKDGIYRGKAISETKNWQKYTYEMNKSVSRDSAGEILIFGVDQATMWVDDVEIMEVPGRQSKLIRTSILSFTKEETYSSDVTSASNTEQKKIKLIMMDVSEIKDPDKKIKKIFENLSERFEKACRQYKIDEYDLHNAVVQQIVEIGEDAIAPLLEQIKTVNFKLLRGPYNKIDTIVLTFKYLFRKKDLLENAHRASIIEDSLNKLLTGKHKDIILEHFEKYTLFSELIKKYKFPETGDILVEKLEKACYGISDIDMENIIDAALILNKEKTIPLLKRCLTKKDNKIVHYQGIAIVPYIAQKLADVPGFDIRPELKVAAEDERWNSYVRAGLAKIMLEKGMKEGLDLSIKALKEREPYYDVNVEGLLDTLKRYSDAQGSVTEIIVWLEKNKDLLKWNEESGKFE